jgi:hypothetical protein
MKKSALLTFLFALVMTLASSAFADEWVHAGSSVRTKSVGPFSAKVYAVRLDLKGRPPKDKAQVINAAIEKKITWKMLRDVDSSKIQKALREAFAMNGFNDAGRINTFVGAFNKDEVKENSAVVISYNPANTTTTIWVQNGATAAVAGEDFMKAVWSIWLGKIDQPSMGDQLISNL